MKFTESSRVSVPWLLLAKHPEEYIDPDCFPEGFQVCDPSKLTKSNVDKLWRHWEQRSKNFDIILQFIKAKSDDMPAAPTNKPKCRLRKRPYVEIDNYSDSDADADDESDKSEDSGASSPSSAKRKPVSSGRPSKPTTTAHPSSPAANKDDRLAFLRGLSADPRYIGLLDRLFNLSIHVSGICGYSTFFTEYHTGTSA